MKSVFVLLVLSFAVSLAAHADEYGQQRPQPEQQRPQIPQDYDEYQDNEVDPQYYGEQREDCFEDCAPPQEFYCRRSGCRAPEVLPYLGPQVHPIPMPHPAAGFCTLVGQPWGWTIVLNGHIPLVSGRPWESQKLIVMKQQYIYTGVCQYFTN